MNTKLKLLLPVILFVVGITLLFAGEFRKKAAGPKGAVTARPTHDQIQEKRKEAKTDAKIKVATEPIEMKKIRSGKTESLVKRSAILSHGQNWTLVPKEAVLHIPAHLKKRVNSERHGKLVGWQDFYAKNRGWIQLQDVSMGQARGEEPFGENTRELYKNAGRVVVAVCHNGPISVKPQKVPELAQGTAPVDTGGIKPVLK